MMATSAGLCRAQTWCRGKKTWESEVICMECHMFTWRAYRDPDFMTPEDYEKARWEKLVRARPCARARVR